MATEISLTNLDYPPLSLPEGLTNEQQGLVNSVANLSRNNFAPRAAIYDRERRFPIEDYQDLTDAGLIGLVVKKKYGGLEADTLTRVLCLMELAKADPSLALTFNMHLTVIDILNSIASAEQKERYFSQVVEAGAKIAAITSEPGSSFRDKFILKTTFNPQSNGSYQVTGSKHFCSFGDMADYYFVSGLRANGQSAKEASISAMVPKHTPGMNITGEWNSIGMRATNSLTINYDCLIDENDIIGQQGGILKADWSGFALGYGAIYLGNGLAAFEYALNLARKKQTVNDLTKWNLGKMATKLEAARQLLFEAARAGKDSTTKTMTVNMVKAFCTQISQEVALEALAQAGGAGVLEDNPISRIVRDSIPGIVMPPHNDRCFETVGGLLLGLEAKTLDFK